MFWPRSKTSESQASPASMRGRPALPSWLLSLLFHLGLFVVLALSVQFTPRGAPGERTAEVGIALRKQDGDQEYFVSEADAHTARTGAVAPGSARPSLEELLKERPPSDPTTSLPKAAAVLGPGDLEGGGVTSAAAATSGPGADRSAAGGRATVRVFNTEGQGYKFVYVFDRSGSMGGSGRNALRAAKQELLKSLDSLDTNHQFQIIFYNERPWQFNPSGQPGKLAFGNQRNKALAARFVRSVTADGATRHEEALKLAIRLQPDVIFFLTDADEPKLSPGQLADIHRRAGGITINAIQFGFGPRPSSDNFLVRLARQNGGQHSYVDVSKIRPHRSN